MFYIYLVNWTRAPFRDFNVTNENPEKVLNGALLDGSVYIQNWSLFCNKIFCEFL